MRIALCDDEEKDLQALKEAVSAFDQNSQLEIYDFSHASKLFAAAKIKPFDIAILDIEMSPPNGYDIAKRLMETKPHPVVIFLTNSMAYTLKGYGIAFRYLTKPIESAQLADALTAAINEASSKRFSFSIDNASYLIPMENIYYFEVFNHHTILHTMDSSYTFRATLKEIIPQLPFGYFGSPHQSYVVNFNHVKTAMAKEVHLTNGEVIPVSRRKQQEFEQQLRAYLRR